MYGSVASPRPRRSTSSPLTIAGAPRPRPHDGWTLRDGDPDRWVLELHGELADPDATWRELGRQLHRLAERRGRRPLLLDLRRGPRLSGRSGTILAQLLRAQEAAGRRVALLIAPDLIQAARVHRLVGFNAPRCGRCLMNEDEARAWLAPLRVPPLPFAAT